MKIRGRGVRDWAPALLLAVGAILVFGGATRQHAMPLQAPLEEAIPRVLGSAEAEDIVISEAEQRVAGMDTYVLRQYTAEGATPFSVYVGYYEQQAQGSTIHSPRNCLPGGGWEPVSHVREGFETPLGEITVNRYLIANGPAQALVLYWYQGRGRVEANEYVVKWHLLTDAALRGRTEEALVRIIMPLSEERPLDTERLSEVVAELVVAVDRALPAS